ncbi:hypothetical protein F0P96_05995 [Hymenobacter busanensis]|uniref:Uncharacterized protein n=1 Tax=Hymenobacter busanensis TaxID=2607656 RepID=A0A7L5A079_9BACT|nr:hypothetical protein [Hymenobacter busanensis]KAA9338384.1 hypothetical protein F0P96_05995 [Hymenobacter busanensis]QHJ09189.1 hypothetical protein GUY19_18610 [Hymenobacter busanensis]
MHSYRLPSALLLALLAACSAPQSDQTASGPTTRGVDSADARPVEPMDTTSASVANAQSDTLKAVRTRHLFSSPTAPDLFQLVLRGDSLLSSEATFTITAADGTVIFRETLSSADLEASMVYQMTKPGATKAEREAYVRRRMNEFFADKNFRKPAVGSTDIYQPGTVDRAVWDDLRRRPDAVGFSYLVGKEDGRRIAWSTLRKQVVRYGSTGG